MNPHRSLLRVILCACMATVAAASQAQSGEAGEQFRQLLLQRMNSLKLLQSPVPVIARSAPSLSEAALAEQLAARPAASGPFTVERFRDGFSINGERVLDPEGRIVQFSVDNATGEATYLMESSPGQAAIKLMRHGAGAAVTIASVSRYSGQWSIETVTGVRVNGSRMNLDPRGFIVARDNALFRYTAGAGLRSYDLPETHTLAAHQNGNPGTTGWLLLEKRQETKQREGGLLGGSSLGNLVNLTKSLGAALGVNKADSDYALYNLESRQIIPVGISLTDKQTSMLSQCQQKNRWVARCDQMDVIESLYRQDGFPNRLHYFWRVSWYQTGSGAIALVMEDNISKIDALDLATGRRVTVFQRTLGIGDWSSAQAADGRVQVTAKLGFESARNDDVARLFLDEPTVAPATTPAAPD